MIACAPTINSNDYCLVIGARNYLNIIPTKKICCTFHIAAEQKAKTTYDNILRLSDDHVNNVIRFLREREVVHFQRFGEALRIATEKMDQKNVYVTNPAFTNK